MEGSLQDTVLGLKKKKKKKRKKVGILHSGSGIPRPRNLVRDVVRCGAGTGSYDSAGSPL